MEKKKIVLMTIVIFVVGLIIAGSSYAFWSWNSSVNKNVVFNTANNLKNYIVYNEGESAFTGELNVSNNYQTGGIHSTISIYKTTNVNLLATIHMDINQIGENMKNSPALKWVVTEGTTSNVGAVLAKGNFIGTKSGDVLTLVPDINVTTTETFYTIWIWLDSSANPSDNLSGETLDTNVWTEINQVEGSEDRYEVTNTTANYQAISATVVDSKYKVTHYAVTTTNSEPTTWTTITPETDQAKVYNLNTTVDNTGTYYIWFKDENGRTKSKEVEVTTIDTSKPSCNWGAFTPVKIANGVTSTVTLTCTDNESGISVHNLQTTDLTPSNNRITISNITKESVTNGYKYTITVTGTTNDGTSHLSLTENKVKNGVNLGNNSTSSGDITVENIISVSDAVVTLEYTSTTYNGSAKTPSVTVTKNGTTLTKDTDYTVTYTNNTNVGTATVTITGINNYDGETTRTFTISYNSFNITLDNADATTNGTSTIYMRYADGVYLNNTYTTKMTTNTNPIIIPQRTGYTFTGYYDGSTQMIDGDGHITSAFTNTKYTSNKTLNIEWIDNVLPTGTISATYVDGMITATISAIDEGSGLNDSENYGWSVSTDSTCDSTVTFVDDTSNTYSFNTTTIGTHYVCVRVKDNNNNVSYISEEVEVDYAYYQYTGDYQIFTVPEDGYYFVETWGAQGGQGANGGYSSGYIYLTAGEELYVYVGGVGPSNQTVTNVGGYNGGGYSGNNSSAYSFGGGGATDIRYFGDTTPSSSDLVWNSTLGLNSRIMVAGGGGGSFQHNSASYEISPGAGGGLFGIKGSGSFMDSAGNPQDPTGGTQTSGGVSGYIGDTTRNGSFGYARQEISGGWGGGGGGGYYGGGIGYGRGGAGGSSFISGFAGVNAITSASNITHTNNTLHYSQKYFIDNTMTADANSDNGKAKITYVGSAPARVNQRLNNVRYVRDCMNGSSHGDSNHWIELQVIKDGINIAKGITITGIQNHTTYPLTRITDGDITSSNYAQGSMAVGYQCVIVDLGNTYNVDEIAVWHYFSDNRTYYENTTFVSSDKREWTIVMQGDSPATSEGKRVNAWEVRNFQDDITYSNINDYQIFTAPISGYYYVETWGAQGGQGANGGYSSGYIHLDENEKIYIYVGGYGPADAVIQNVGGYNGGGPSGYNSSANGYGGGGATDIRYFGDTTPSSSDFVWNSALGLNSRIMVAAGGGGSFKHNTNTYTITPGDGGGLTGANGTGSFTSSVVVDPTGGTQISGGTGGYKDDTTRNGTFGQASQEYFTGFGGGGGGGYYGGGSGYGRGAAGGSSFISGFAGVNAITSSRTHTNNTLHYSNKYFIDDTTISGTNPGDGKAKVTYVGSFPERVNYKLNNVRYVRDCMNGSSNGSSNHWVELQVIKDGINIAKGIQVTGITNNTSKPLSRITDGDITSANYAEGATATGNQCIILDLGAVYQVDEIAVWHYWSDGRTYNSNVTSVSSDGTNYTAVIDHTAAETANGKRINAWFMEDGSNITITYNANGGTGAPSPTTYAYDSSGNGTTNLSSVIPTWLEHTFLGWARFSTATTPEYAAGEEWNKINKSTTLYAVWAEGYICQAGTYLRHGETACVTCPAGYGCAGGTFDYDADNDQGIIQCRAGTFSAGGQSTCQKCTAGSYSTTVGASSCTACPTGTTSVAGSTSANACTTCTNNSNVTGWKETSWNTNNQMTNLCSVNSCATNYVINNNQCVYGNYTKTTTTCIYTSYAASSSTAYQTGFNGYVNCNSWCSSRGGSCMKETGDAYTCRYTVYSCPSYGATLASNNRCYYTTTEVSTTTGTSCTPQTQFSTCNYDNRDKVNITCTQ